MSYDLVVWEGDRPSDDGAAASEFERLAEFYLESGDAVGPSPRIAAYVLALLDRYPDIDIDIEVGDDSPWAVAPLISAACGPVMHFPMQWSRCEEVSAWAAQLAHEHGLVCFDPQLGKLRPDLERSVAV